ncbi:hypothetical protein L226DRAFT_569511 [Lentinus tigrinus ALCF2SS1-7]|uniref:uncharacterized protein n=1 Tax=Lentinus tigrinus ALCF2SS1-7 TaxID=1328758 RepID=UPI001165EE4A|nr:hypothetical protein L226DRAFT_569511 [Lentinus tigrinus ALCF2SS1-7]
MNAPNGSTNTTSPQPTQAQRELDQLWAKLEAKDLIPDGYGIRKREKKRISSPGAQCRPTIRSCARPWQALHTRTPAIPSHGHKDPTASTFKSGESTSSSASTATVDPAASLSLAPTRESLTTQHRPITGYCPALLATPCGRDCFVSHSTVGERPVSATACHTLRAITRCPWPSYRKLGASVDCALGLFAPSSPVQAVLTPSKLSVTVHPPTEEANICVARHLRSSSAA